MSGRAKEKALLERIAANAGKVPLLGVEISDVGFSDPVSWSCSVFKPETDEALWTVADYDRAKEFRIISTILIDLIEAAELAVFERYRPFGSPPLWRGFLRSNGFHDSLCSLASEEHLAMLECITLVLEALPEVAS